MTAPRSAIFGELEAVQALLDHALARQRDGDAAPMPDVSWDRLVRTGSPFDILARVCDLDEVAAGLVVLCVAPVVSHRAACGYAVLRHDPDATPLSLGVVMELLGVDGARGLERVFAALRPGAPLCDLMLVDTPAAGLVSMQGSVTPSARLVGFLLGDSDVPADIAMAARIEAPRTAPEPLLSAAAARELADAVAAAGEAARAGEPAAAPVCLLTGPPGSGRGLCALHLAKALGRPLLRADIRGFASKDPQRMMAAARHIVRETRLQGALLYLEGVEAVEPALHSELRHLLDSCVPCYALGSSDSLSGSGLVPTGRRVMTISLQRPSAADRLTLWQRYFPKRPAAVHGCLEAAAHKYLLTGGQIVRAAAQASESARTRGHDAVTPELLDGAIRASVSHALSTVAREVRPTEGWDDLVAGDETRLLLRVMMANYKNRRKVLDDWGFARRFGRGLGMSALFSGPPGTGKTMAAGLLAAALGLPLYQVELSSVVSKWVGETEKNIDSVFTEAEAVSAVVLFDEADSLFAKRTEVSSANDRYANLEVNHLLQRIEGFEGIVVLTTNNDGAIDRAFLRRFSYHLVFPLPDEAQRARLWERMLPPDANIAHPIPCEALAKEFEFSGGHIKNAVIRAAYFAAELDCPLDARLLRLTSMLEQKQLGVAVRNMDVGALWRELGGE